MDNRNRTPQSNQDRQSASRGSSPGPRQHNPHHSAIGEPGSRRQSSDPQRERNNQNTDIDDDQMDNDRDEDQDIDMDESTPSSKRP
jgi:hypothetical protein